MSNTPDVFDLEEYARSSKTIPPHARHFRIRVDESTLEITAPNPTGREILAEVGKSPDNHFLTQILVGEDDQVVEPDEHVNLLRPGIERFTVVAKPHPDCGCPTKLFIFVNRVKKTAENGVKPKMTGEEIAALVGVPREKAVVKRDDAAKTEIGLDETVTICEGEHFLVTRDKVNGGYE